MTEMLIVHLLPVLYLEMCVERKARDCEKDPGASQDGDGDTK